MLRVVSIAGSGRRIATGLVAATTALAWAHQAQAIDVTLGLGAGFAPDYEGSEDYEVVPAWLLVVNDLYHPATNVTLRSTELRSNFVPHPQLRAGLAGQYIGERDDVEDTLVDRLPDTDNALMLGGSIGWDFFPEPTRSLTVALEATADVANNNGYNITPYVAYAERLPQSPIAIGAELSATYADEDYMEEFFGIGANAAAQSGLDAFDPDAGFKDARLRLSGTYSFTENWATTAVLQYKRLVDEAADSPIVDDRGDENQFVLGLTVNYRF